MKVLVHRLLAAACRLHRDETGAGLVEYTALGALGRRGRRGHQQRPDQPRPRRCRVGADPTRRLRDLMRRRTGQAGFTLPAYLFGVTAVLVFFVLLIQFVVWQYGRGVVRAALDEGARAGAVASAEPRTCEYRAHDVLKDLLAGRLGQDVDLSCADEGDEIVARARVTFRSWLAPAPDWTFAVAATAVKEQLP